MKFVWNNKPAKIKHSILINDIKDCGLKLLDPKSFCEALKLSWVKIIFEKESSCIWTTLVCNWLPREVKIKIPSLNAFDICFGYNITNPDLLVNHFILISKSHIYNCKIGGRIPALSSCKNLIDTIRCKEKTIAFNSNKNR